MTDGEIPNIGSNWLTSHFLAKSSARFSQVSQLPIFPGDHLLDLGCGNGLYCDFFSHMVGPTGSVVGIDKSKELIDQAISRITTNAFASNQRYFEADISGDCEFLSDKKFDVIVVFNTLPYLNQPAVFLQNLRKRLSIGGRLILKSSDFGHLLIEPFDQALLSMIVIAAQGDVSLEYCNFFGRKIPGLVRQLSGIRSNIIIWSYPFQQPLGVDARRYIKGNLHSLGLQAKERISNEVYLRWNDCLGIETGRSLLDMEDFFLCMHEVVGIVYF